VTYVYAEQLAQTELRDFIAAINDGSFTFDSGSILDSEGDMFAPASMEVILPNPRPSTLNP